MLKTGSNGVLVANVLQQILRSIHTLIQGRLVDCYRRGWRKCRARFEFTFVEYPVPYKKAKYGHCFQLSTRDILWIILVLSDLPTCKMIAIILRKHGIINNKSNSNSNNTIFINKYSELSVKISFLYWMWPSRSHFHWKVNKYDPKIVRMKGRTIWNGGNLDFI